MHHIPALFNEAMSLICINKPKDPKDYMVDLLKNSKLEGNKVVLKETLLKKDDFDEIFNILDVLDRKSISYGGLLQGL